MVRLFRSALLLTAVVVAGVLPAPCAAGRSPTAIVDVIAYNDVYEMLQDDVNGVKLGGPSRVVQIAKKMRCTNPNSLVLFAGDTMSPSLWSSQFRGVQMVDAHNAIGVDFASLGNHEFDFGIDPFLNVSKASNFPWLNANCFEIGTQKLLRGTVPNVVKELSDCHFGKIKIGLFGVMYDMKNNNTGLYWSDPIEAAKEQVKLLKAQGVDIVIALTHQDLADDDRFSKEVAGVTVIYGGHDHYSMLQTNYGTPYLKSDFDFRSIWMSHIEYFAFVNASFPATTRMIHHSVPVVEDMPTDPALEKVIADYAVKIGDLHARVIGSLCEPLDVTNKVVRAMDAAAGAIFSDASLAFYGPNSADVAVNNGGGIRSDRIYPAGPLTSGQVIAWSPFGNLLMVIETDGASLKKYITREMVGSCGANRTTVLNGYYVHPAGFKYTFMCTDKGVGSVASIEWFKHPTRTGPLLDSEVVKVAMIAFLYKTEFLATPGAVVRRVIVSEVEAGRFDTALEQYVKSFPGGNMCVKADGRSTLLVT